MSSTLTTMVPLLDGSNFQVWSQQIGAYLMSQGWLRIVQKGLPTDTKDLDGIEKFEDANSKALGAILLRLHFTIAYKHRAQTYATDLLTALKEEYGRPGVSGIFLEFKKLM